MVKCSKCSTDLPDDAIACYKCASPVWTPPQPSVQAKNNGKVIAVSGAVTAAIVGVAVGVLIIGVMIAAFIYVSERQRGMADAERRKNQRVINGVTYENIPPAPPPPLQPTVLIDDAFNVDARAWRTYNISLNRPARVHGWFNVSGGTDTAKCLIMDSPEYENWKNSGDYRRYYDSGNVTNGKIDIRLDAGSYIVVYYNPELFNNKTMKTKIVAE